MGAARAAADERRNREETDKSVAITEVYPSALADLEGDGLPAG